MRVLILSGTVAMAAVAAQAASVDEVATSNAERSIEHISCTTCAPLKTRTKKESSEVTLEPGTQKIEIRDVDGVRKIFRTEAWMGGSPVVFVSKAPEEAPSDSVAQNADTGSEQMTAPVTIDKEATTSAVAADISGQAEVKQAKNVAATPDFKPEQLELRLK